MLYDKIEGIIMDKDYLFNDWKEKIKNQLGKTEWVTICAQEGAIKNVDQGGMYSALIPPKKIKTSLKDYQWDLMKGSGRPGFISFHKEGEYVTEYYRISDDGIEPFVHWRHFPDRMGYTEISEEFRLYFDLYEVRKDDHQSDFIFFDDNGDEEVVVKILANETMVKLKFLKEYLSIRKMYLAIFFDLMRFSKQSISELALKEIEKVEKGKDYIFSHCLRHIHISSAVTQSWLMGKKIIAPNELYEADTLISNKGKKYEEFIIGLDENGNPKYYTSNEDKLANFFGKNKGAPYFLTPVFFKKEVLSKYYNSPEIYSVDDGHVRRKGFWGLRIDNNHPECIMAYLGDLGRLSNKEQLYWKSYNIAYQGGISRVAWERNFEAKFTDPEQPDLFFKYRFTQFQEAWYKKFNWYLFKPLSKEDGHHFQSLHIPLSNNQKEFDEQILSITKLLIDSLNEKELSRGIQLRDGAKGIEKFDGYLESKVLQQPRMIEFLRNLQSLRSTSVAHRKSLKKSEYAKAKAYFALDKKDLKEVFIDILIKCIWTLNFLDKYLIKEDKV